MHVILIYDSELLGYGLREILVTPNPHNAYKLFTSCVREKGVKAVWYFDPDRKKFESED